MSNYYSDEKQVGDLDFKIENLDNHFGSHKYGYRPIAVKKGVSSPVWNGDTYREIETAQNELKKKIKDALLFP